MNIPNLSEIRKKLSSSAKEDDVELGKNEIVLGFDLVNSIPYVVDISLTRHFLGVGMQSSGKSILVHKLVDDYYKQGAAINVINDKHGEFRHKERPNRLHRRMLEFGSRLVSGVHPDVFYPLNEQPFGWTNLVRYSPEFAYVNGTTPFSFKITDLAEEDWGELMSISSQQIVRQMIFTLFYRHLATERKANYNKRVDKKFIQSCVDPAVLGKYAFFTSQAERLSQEGIEGELEKLWKYFIEKKVFEGDYATSIPDMFYDTSGNRINFVVDWTGYEEGLTERVEFNRDAYLAILCKWLLMEAKEIKEREVKMASLTVLDEAQQILTTDINTYTVNFLKKIYSEGRKYNMHVAIAFQGEIKKVPLLLYENTDLLLISSQNANASSMRFLKDSHQDIFESHWDISDFQKFPNHFFLARDKHNPEVPVTIIVGYPPLSTQYGAEAL